MLGYSDGVLIGNIIALSNSVRFDGSTLDALIPCKNRLRLMGSFGWVDSTLVEDPLGSGLDGGAAGGMC